MKTKLPAFLLFVFLAVSAAAGYDPNIQRWLTQDPIGIEGGLNLYQFVGNDPVNKVDPFGLQGVISGESRMPDLFGNWPNQLRAARFMNSLYPGPGAFDFITKEERARVHGEIVQLGEGLARATYGLTPLGSLKESLTRTDFDGNRLTKQELCAARQLTSLDTATFLFPVGRLGKIPCPPGAGRLRLNIFGEGEARGFLDVASDARFANGRPLTSGLGAGSASDIFIRNAPITGENTIPEIMRLSQPGTRITLLQDSGSFQGQALIDAFGNNANVDFVRTFTTQNVPLGLSSTEMTILRMTVGDR